MAGLHAYSMPCCRGRQDAGLKGGLQARASAAQARESLHPGKAYQRRATKLRPSLQDQATSVVAAMARFINT